MNNKIENKKSEALAVPIEIKLTNNGVVAQEAVPGKKGKRVRIARPGLPYAIASFCLGVVSLVAIVVLGFFSLATVLPYGIGIVAAIMGITFGAIAKKRGDCSGMATAGLVMNIVPLAIGAFIIFVVMASCVGLAGCMSLLAQ